MSGISPLLDKTVRPTNLRLFGRCAVSAAVQSFAGAKEALQARSVCLLQVHSVVS